MDLTPYLQSEHKSHDEEPLLFVAINGKHCLGNEGTIFPALLLRKF